jgi:HAD superfamily hydrolase (TIGR01509 family)
VTDALKALVWDVDGTLAETERDGHRVAFNRAFADAGLPWHWDEAQYGELLRVTGGKERMLRWWQRVDPAAAAAQDAPQRIAMWHALKTRHYEALVAGGAVALRPGVEALLRAARDEGLPLAIATTTQPANVQALLGHTLGAGAVGWFACIGAGDVVPRKKPAPDIYRWVLKRLALLPHETLAIEDSAPGVAAARAAGVPVVAVRSAYTRDDDLRGVLAEFGSLGDVDLAGLRRLHARAVSA